MPDTVPVVGHIQDVLLRSNRDLLEDLLTRMLADVVANHDTVGLWSC